MRAPLSIGDWTGALSLAAMLLLASPGVEVARAGEAGTDPLPSFAGVVEPAASCRVDEAGQRAAATARMAELQARARARLMQQALGAGPGDRVVALDGRGYNYRVERNPLAELALIRAEVERRDRAGAEPQAGSATGR